MTNKSLSRCDWCHGDELYQHYHDHEWGVPLHDDQSLFEFLSLEGAQAGLAWITVLRKRDAYKQLFDDFNIKKVAGYSDKKLDKLLTNPAIIRNRLKVYSVRNNAKAVMAIQNEFGSLNHFLWSYVNHQPLQNSYTSVTDLPAATTVSEQLSKDLKKRGFNFVGPTIMYAFMQATGMVNDHLTSCYRQPICAQLATSA
ncbi:DNA-3-methyladenine glycosylase I [Dasania marina]|uniref:DNA-3-methyladenine glycosylase I n=1 Tax=Dasania marina TaxID=471499 RepID=UPI00037A53E8|nr:DNA-3-methyladenine glycosylase I [Dasania marina]